MPDYQPYLDRRILVGIDLGLTCTGVAYCTTDWNRPKIIQTWPGINEIKSKVPTAVEYRAGNRDFKSWGFECPPPRQVESQRGVKDLFKLYLDERYLDETFGGSPGDIVGTYDDIKNWYTDFLQALYEHIGDHIKTVFRIADWSDQHIDFLFSFPTTWHDGVIAEFRKVVKSAGFGKGGRGHSVKVKLTEAEAAAVYTADTARQQNLNDALSDTMSESEHSPEDLKLKEGDVVLVCDSGGGTTDVAIVKVSSLKSVDVGDEDERMGKLAELQPIGEPNGIAIGSVQIDEDFREILEDCLRRITAEHPNITFSDTDTDQLVKKEFQAYKLQLGTPLDLPTYQLRIPGLAGNFNLPEANIEDGRFILTQKRLQNIFDNKIGGIFNLIDKQLVAENKTTHLVLSGGLCSSEYVQKKLRGKYEGRMKILIANDPQLAVCKGLVIDRLHQLRYSNFILPNRYIRNSYGIVSSELFSTRKHFKQRKFREKDPNDDKEYIRQIQWIIHQGKGISRAEPINHTFYRNVDIGKEKIIWKDPIARSTAPTHARLPIRLDEGDARRICDIVSELTIEDPAEFEKKEGVKRKKVKHIFGLKGRKEFWRVELDLFVRVLTEHLRFDIEFAGNTIGSQKVPVEFILSRRGSEDDGDSGGGVETPLEEDPPGHLPLISRPNRREPPSE